MSGAAVASGGRLGMMLSDLRLPTIKRLADDLCAQSDREGWPLVVRGDEVVAVPGIVEAPGVHATREEER